MENFVEYIIKNLADDPDSVKVECFKGRRGILIEIKAAKKDIGKIVGNQGRTINALRTIASIVASRMQKRVRLEIIE